MLKRFFSFFAFVFIIQYVVIAQIPTGYYNTATGLTGATLKTALHNIIKGHTERTYANLWTDLQSTDKKSNGKVWDMYSDIPGGIPPYEFTFVTDQCGNYSAEGDCYNREHSFPKSWFNDGSPMYTDLFHIVPTDGKVNGERSNFPFGDVNNPTWTSQNGSKLGPNVFPGYSGTVFEPIDSFKGDFARNYFYMVTCYQNLLSNWSTVMLDNSAFPSFTVWAKNLLIEWNNLDPVSQKEINRNNAVYLIQNNRNPYIDHPEYVAAVWGGGSDIFVNYTDLSDKISVYPIPATDLLNIDIKSMTNLPDNITITDIRGKFIYQTTQASTHQKLDVSMYESGMYFITFSGNNYKSVFKFIR